MSGAEPYAVLAVLLLPYDLRERMMLGDAGSNALGAVLGLSLVARLTARERWIAVGCAAALNYLGERTSLGALIERTPILSTFDRLGRVRGSSSPQTKYVFVTGGVVSSSREGHHRRVARRSAQGARPQGVQVQKLDPYLNVDPGTMSPFQHGEVFVTEDGAETDLDLGHYERFIDENLSPELQRHRGLGLRRRHPQGAPRRLPRATVQVIPHVTNEIKDRMRLRRAERRRRGHHPRSAEPSATSSRCRSSRQSASSARRRAARTSATSTSRSCRSSTRRRAQDEADAALGQRAAAHRYPAGLHRLPVARRPLDAASARRSRCSATSSRRRSSRQRRHRRRLPGARCASRPRVSTRWSCERLGLDAARPT